MLIIFSYQLKQNNVLHLNKTQQKTKESPTEDKT